MKQHEAENFIYDNKEALELLANKLKEIDTVRENKYSEYPEESRRLALEIVESWMIEIFGAKKGELFFYQEEEENLYKRLDAGRR